MVVVVAAGHDQAIRIGRDREGREYFFARTSDPFRCGWKTRFADVGLAIVGDQDIEVQVTRECRDRLADVSATDDHEPASLSQGQKRDPVFGVCPRARNDRSHVF